MKTRISTLILALFISTITFAQEEMFKVLASKGDNKVVHNGAEQKVLIGKKLFKEDKIILSEGAYLGLAHKNGKTIELKKAGTYEVAKLSSEVASQNASVAKKYVDFVAGEMSSKDEDMAENRHKYMAVTGSVERPVPNAIKVLVPKEAYAIGGQVTLKWQPVDKADAYILTVTDLAEEPIYTTEVTENFASLDLDKLNFKETKYLIWKVVVKNNKKADSDKCIIKYVDEEKAANLEKQTAEMKSELSAETALNKLVLASYYEDNGLILDALSNYEAAMKLEPEVEDYRVAYGKFLERNKLTEKPAEGK